MSRLQDVIEEMKKFITGFEVRKEQFMMMEAVYDSMKHNKKAAVHAPTGTGKSLGYLLPYVAVKLENPKFRMTINTHTLALQAQLQKDIDLANKVYLSLLEKYGRPTFRLNTVILKGNSHYFCEKRFQEAKSDNLPFNLVEEVEQKLKFRPVLIRDEMNVEMSDTNWNRLKVDGCIKRACPFKENCTYFQQYSKIDTYDIVIANHALFFFRFLYSDRFWEGFDFHVFDESHKLEKGMLDAATYELSYRHIENWVYHGAKIAERLGANVNDVESWKMKHMESETVVACKTMFDMMTNAFKEPNTASVVEELGVPKLSVQRMVRALYDWQKIMYQDMVDNVLDFVQDKDENEDFQKARTSWAMNLLALKEFGNLSNHNDEIALIWCELKGKGNGKRAVVKATPNSIDYIPSPFGAGFLFTSGTIAQNGSCQPIARRLNTTIDIDLVLSTPFPLAKRTGVFISEDINPKMKNWKPTLEEAIYQHIRAGNQKVFVLFTSAKLMQDMYQRLLPRLYDLQGEKPMETWMQEDGNYNDVIDSFKNLDVRSVLFGTLTYFEGVDLKGDALTQVILTRLPYSPPHPIQSILEKKAGYGQWEALTRYEQAYGRIMRTSTDYGMFSVLDSRVSYLKEFRQIFENDNIPITNRIEDVYKFYQEK